MRPSEWLLAGYFVYTSLLALVLPLTSEIVSVTLALNLAILAGYALLAHVASLRRTKFFSVLRDWYPFPLMLLCYREMGWFAQPQHTRSLENAWVVWDRLLLKEFYLRAVIESLGPLFPAILEICYSLVYVTGLFALAMLYRYGKRKRADELLFTFILGVLLSYAQFPYWPSEPPWTVFPGDEFPSYQTIFRQFNAALLGGYGIHTSVFPSAHVSGAFSAAFGTMQTLPERPWVGRALLIMAFLIATATVYGRYHYLADAAAGFAVACIAAGISKIRSRVASSTAFRVKGMG
jgi:membrane-associated phospholipid phosphatase